MNSRQTRLVVIALEIIEKMCKQIRQLLEPLDDAPTDMESAPEPVTPNP